MDWDIGMAFQQNRISGHGAYVYNGKLDSGEHELIVQGSTCDLEISGHNTSQPGGKSFWRRAGVDVKRIALVAPRTSPGKTPPKV